MISVLLLCLMGSALSADILAVFPHTGKSHWDVFQPLMLALAARGHNVTVISFYPQQTPVPNYTDISLVGLVPLHLSQVLFSELDNSLLNLESMTHMGVEMCEKILTYDPVRRLLASDSHFDLLIVEFFNTDCFLSLAHKYNVPYVGINSANSTPHQDARVGCPAHPAYVSHPDLPFSSSMSLTQKLVNLAYDACVRVVHAYFTAQEQRLVARLVGDVPSLDVLAYNVSIFLVNTHHSMLGSRPMVPAYVEVGGLHISPARELNKELDQFLNESSEGVILFSMGSVLQSSSFPADKRQAVMDAFAELPVRVIMKWENDSLPGKPDNVRLSQWLPQRDLLAHSKIVAFMGHGGLLSTSEAVYCSVPMVLIPMFGDQPNNVAHLESTGAAIKLDYEDITKETVLKALKAVLYDQRYKDKAKALSAQFRDRPMSPLDTAVYWTEYVLRHKGAPHLRSAAVDMPWYQLWLLDVVLALLAGLAALMVTVFWLAKRITIIVARILYSKSTKRKKND